MKSRIKLHAKTHKRVLALLLTLCLILPVLVTQVFNPPAAAAAPITITAGRVPGVPGGQVIIPISVSGNLTGIANFDFNVYYNTAQLTYVEHSRGPLWPVQNLLEVNANVPATRSSIKVVGAASASSIAPLGGELINLTFNVAANAPGTLYSVSVEVVEINYIDGTNQQIPYTPSVTPFISLAPAVPLWDFGMAVAGTTPSSLTVNVINRGLLPTGDITPDQIQIQVSSPSSGAISLVATTISSIAPGRSGSFTIVTNTNVSPEVYTATVTCLDMSFNVRFTVVADVTNDIVEAVAGVEDFIENFAEENREFVDDLQQLLNGTMSLQQLLHEATQEQEEFIEALKEEIDDAITEIINVGINELIHALQSEEDDTRELIDTLETYFTALNGITVGTAVGDNVNINENYISFTGAGLNADDGETEVTLVFKELEDTLPPLPPGYESTASSIFPIDISLEGVVNQANLTVPVTIRMPIPPGVPPNSTIVILHYRNGHAFPPDIITPRVIGDMLIFTVTGFSTFVFTSVIDDSELIEIGVKPESGYTINATNQFITGVAANTTVNAFLANLVRVSGRLDISDLRVFDMNDNPRTGTQLVGTGSYVTVDPNIAEANEKLGIVVIKGDIDGDGEITPNDAILALRDAMLIITLDPVQSVAMDVDGDGSKTPNDAIMLLRFVMLIISSFD
jgi:vacuolar-type H+-ATPase subunit H